MLSEQAEVRNRHPRPTVRHLCDLYNNGGLKAVSKGLGMHRATAWYWMLRLGVRVQRVAVSPGETIRIFRQEPPKGITEGPRQSAEG